MNKITKWLLKYELRKHSQDKKEGRDISLLAKIISTKPKLSRTVKADMLNAIIPQKKQYHLVPAFAVVVAVCVLSISPFVVRSKPGDGPLYSIKQKAETLRGVIQPGFEPTDSRSTVESLNDDHSDAFEDSHEDNSGRGGSKDDDSSHSGSSSNDDKASSDVDDSNDGHNESVNNHNAVRDACRAELDAREDAGEEIDSDRYKDCDLL